MSTNFRPILSLTTGEPRNRKKYGDELCPISSGSGSPTSSQLLKSETKGIQIDFSAGNLFRRHQHENVLGDT